MNTSSLVSKVALVVGRPSTRCMSSTAKVWVDKNTRVICQGFTGKQVGRLLYCLRKEGRNRMSTMTLFLTLIVRLPVCVVGNLSLDTSH
jgi:hypothetical protein